jgi:DNA-binding transcriptional ArsR family regulator
LLNFESIAISRFLKVEKFKIFIFFYLQKLDFFIFLVYIYSMNLDEDYLEIYVMMCRIISKPVRLKIIHMIGQKKLNVSQLQKELDISMSSLSNHLNDLYRSGVLGREKQGNYVYYHLAEPKLLSGITGMQDILKCINLKRTGSNQVC